VVDSVNGVVRTSPCDGLSVAAPGPAISGSERYAVVDRAARLVHSRLRRREALVADPVRLVGGGAELLAPEGLVVGDVAQEEAHLAVALEGQNMGRDAVQEPAVVADDDHAAGERLQSGLQRAQRVDVQVVGRLVEQQHVAAGLEQLGQVDAVPLPSRQRADELLLVGAAAIRRPPEEQRAYLYDLSVARCTAPVLGHIRGGGADCPVHGRSYGGYRGFGGYGGVSYSPPVYRPPAPARVASYASRSSAGGGRGGSTSRTRRSSVTYSPREYQTLNPVREQVIRIAQTYPDRRDLFLCHAWADRDGAALELYNLLVGLDVKVWFSEKDVPLGTSLLRQIDKGLANSRAGIVLVTPALLKSIQTDGIADRELSALLATDRVIPVAHGTTFEALREVSPLLAARSGLSTADSSLEDVATKVADVALLD
jgi:hypothetical protein